MFSAVENSQRLTAEKRETQRFRRERAAQLELINNSFKPA
jgi:hypothetical protein